MLSSFESAVFVENANYYTIKWINKFKIGNNCPSCTNLSFRKKNLDSTRWILVAPFARSFTSITFVWRREFRHFTSLLMNRLQQIASKPIYHCCVALGQESPLKPELKSISLLRRNSFPQAPNNFEFNSRLKLQQSETGQKKHLSLKYEKRTSKLFLLFSANALRAFLTRNVNCVWDLLKEIFDALVESSPRHLDDRRTEWTRNERK